MYLGQLEFMLSFPFPALPSKKGLPKKIWMIILLLFFLIFLAK